MSIRQGKCAFVVFSHKTYTDVWPILIKSYEQYLDAGECDFYITSDNRADAMLLSGTKFTHLFYDPDLSWSDAFFSSVSEIDYERYIFSFDDLILSKPAQLDELHWAIEQSEYDYLKLICSHVRLRNRIFQSGRAFTVPSSDSYRGSLVFTLMSDRLLKALSDTPELSGKSAWGYERDVNMNLPEKFQYGGMRKNILRFRNLVIKGRVDPLSKTLLSHQNKLKYSGNRQHMKVTDFLNYYLKLAIFTPVKYVLPPSWFRVFRSVKHRYQSRISGK